MMMMVMLATKLAIRRSVMYAYKEVFNRQECKHGSLTSLSLEKRMMEVFGHKSSKVELLTTNSEDHFPSLRYNFAIIFL